MDAAVAEMIALCREHSAHALEQCMWFVTALEEGDEDAAILGGNPDLVAALGYQTADHFLRNFGRTTPFESAGWDV